jgi:RNA polymerase sigma-70 factor (ECF subfamily)
VGHLEKLFEEQGPRLWRSVFLFSGDREIASDAVAEAFAQALRRGEAIRSIDRWVWRAAFRIAAGELARRSRQSAELPEAEVQLSAETIELVVALPRLSPKERAAVVLHYYADYSIREVADITDSTPSAVGVRLYRGRRHLRELLEDNDG